MSPSHYLPGDTSQDAADAHLDGERHALRPSSIAHLWGQPSVEMRRELSELGAEANRTADAEPAWMEQCAMPGCELAVSRWGLCGEHAVEAEDRAVWEADMELRCREEDDE